MIANVLLFVSSALLILIIFQVYEIPSICLVYCSDDDGSNSEISIENVFGQPGAVVPHNFSNHPAHGSHVASIAPSDFTTQDMKNSTYLINVIIQSNPSIRNVIDKFNQASSAELQDSYSILDYLDNPNQIKYVLSGLDSRNLSKVLHNLPVEERENIYNILNPKETLDIFLKLDLGKNECFSNNVTTTGPPMNYTLIEICKR